MRMRTIAALATIALTGGCATTNTAPMASAPIAIESESIRYETSRCFGTCPVYAVTVQPDGRGTFEGRQFTAVTGIREFRVTPAQYRAFAAKLAAYRPTQGERVIEPGSEACGNAATDMPSVEVRWSELSGASQRLSYYFGCRMEDSAMRDALRTAPDALPIAELIGAR